jgi:hypothetical protein
VAHVPMGRVFDCLFWRAPQTPPCARENEGPYMRFFPREFFSKTTLLWSKLSGF